MIAKGRTKETIRALGAPDLNLYAFGIGDSVRVTQRIKEAGKERLQEFEGDVIAIRKKGASSTFTVRKIGAHSIGVERIFPFASPLIKEIKLLKKGSVRRAKLYFMRDRVGKAAQVKKLVETKTKQADEVNISE